MGGTPQGPYGKPPSGQPGDNPTSDFVSSAIQREVHFAKWGVDPPGLQYVTLDDLLMVGFVSNVANPSVQVNVRLQPAGGYERPLQYTIVGPAAHTVSRSTFPMREGFVLSATMAPTVALTAGQYIFGWLGLNRVSNVAPNDFDTLWSGYLLNGAALGYPNGPYQRPTDGPGTRTTVNVGAPAAGSEWLFTCPAKTRQQVLAVTALFNTSATVANRYPMLQKKLGGATSIWVSYEPTAQTAGTGLSYYWAPGQAVTNNTNVSFAQAFLPIPLIMLSTDTLGSLTAGLQATDQYSAINLEFLEWADLV